MFIDGHSMKRGLMKKIIDKNKLTIPIYLNTKIVFDMLATIEDGFSEVKNIQTSKSKNNEVGAEANIGASNLFALLSVGIKGTAKNSNNTGETVSEEKTHTTVSLFQKLKSMLEEDAIIKREVDEFEVGDFVELQGTLKTNPLIDVLNGVKELMGLANLFTESRSNNKNKSQKLMSDNKLNSQIDGLIVGLQADGKKDIICESNDLSIIIQIDENYFLNNSMREVTDGNYKILGKVVQICLESGEISLLRNTVFSKLKLDKMKEFQDLFSEQTLGKFVGDGGMKTVINAPVIMIIPIAIYI